jgi:hypothetical protein
MDLDILISDKHFKAAVKALEASGFVSAHEGLFFWDLFRGERHLRPQEPEGWSIDLHRKLQQPGAPSPDRTDVFLERAVSETIGARTVPCVSRDDALLISAMNLVKAMHRRDGVKEADWRSGAAGYACDLLIGLNRGAPEAVDAFLSHAEQNGVRRMGLFALRIVASVFGLQLGDHSVEVKRILSRIDDVSLARMTIAPNLGTAWPTPVELLRETSDGPLRRAREIGWYAASEVGRKISRGLRLARAERSA